jgi:hypothetical protein
MFVIQNKTPISKGVSRFGLRKGLKPKFSHARTGIVVKKASRVASAKKEGLIGSVIVGLAGHTPNVERGLENDLKIGTIKIKKGEGLRETAFGIRLKKRKRRVAAVARRKARGK